MSTAHNLSGWVCFLSLLAFFLLAGGAALQESPVFDEPVHMVSGLASWKIGDCQLDPSNPPLIGYWLSLPLLAMHARFPAKQRSDYAGHIRSFSFFVSEHQAKPDQLLLASRFMNLLLAMVLGLLVFFWSREALGPIAASSALLAYGFCPALLAHGHLATCDVGGALFSFLWVYSLWLWNRSGRISMAFMSGLFFGLALGAKFFAPAIGVVGVTIVVVQKWILEGKPVPLRRGLVMGLVFIMGSWASLVILYHGWGIPSWIHGFREILGQLHEGHQNYFFGNIRPEGWLVFYVATFLLKTPAVLVLIIATGVFLALRGRYENSRFTILWTLCPSIAFLAIASVSSINVGIRHILIIYPFLCMWVGGTVASLWIHQRLRIFAALLGICYVVETLVAFPSYIPYFSAVVGGSGQGYRYLLDSNVDWGQGLKALSRFCAGQGVGKVYLSYFGCADPHRYGLKFASVAPVTCTEIPDDGNGDLGPGQKTLLAVSLTNRQGLYYVPHSIMEWLGNRKPVSKILDSIWVYDISNDAEAHRALSHIFAAEGRTEAAKNERRWFPG